MDTKQRFTLVVRDFRILAEKMCIVGKPFGDYKTGDALYIRRSNLPVVKLNVEFTSFKDDMMEIYIEGINLPDKLEYAVVTDVEPQGAVTPNVPVENPFLLGLCREYKENYKTPEFLNEFCFSLINAKFVVPVISPELGTKALEDKKAQVSVGFTVITTQKGRKVLPIFTDWGALSAWKSFREAEAHKTLILSFDQVVDITSRDSDGVSINAFDIGVVVPMQFIESIKNSDGYKKMNEMKATKMTSKSGTVQVGIPQDSNEQVKLIKEALTTFSKTDDRVKETYLFLKKDGNDIAFLVVFDLDMSITETQRTTIFANANKELTPILGGKVAVEFAMKAPHFIKLCNAYVPVYKAD